MTMAWKIRPIILIVCAILFLAGIGLILYSDSYRERELSKYPLDINHIKPNTNQSSSDVERRVDFVNGIEARADRWLFSGIGICIFGPTIAVLAIAVKDPFAIFRRKVRSRFRLLHLEEDVIEVDHDPEEDAQHLAAIESYLHER